MVRNLILATTVAAVAATSRTVPAQAAMSGDLAAFTVRRFQIVSPFPETPAGASQPFPMGWHRGRSLCCSYKPRSKPDSHSYAPRPSFKRGVQQGNKVMIAVARTQTASYPMEKLNEQA
jgi:hypothetical protein